jgi:hypothetical protein
LELAEECIANEKVRSQEMTMAGNQAAVEEADLKPEN